MPCVFANIIKIIPQERAR